MKDYMQVLRQCMAEAPRNKDAAVLLRSIVSAAGERAPVSTLVELAQALIDIRNKEVRQALERN